MKKILSGMTLLCLFSLVFEKGLGEQFPPVTDYSMQSTKTDFSVKRSEGREKTKVYKKNSRDLLMLLEKGFSIDEKQMQKLKEGTDTVLKVDLFKNDNMKAALINVFEFVFDEHASNNFIMGNFNLPKSIKGNVALYQKMQEFKNNLKTFPEKFGNTEADIQVNILKELKDIHAKLVKDKSIGKKDPFTEFVGGMIKLYQVRIARRLADQIMQKHRATAENKLITTTKSTSYSGSASANVDGVKLGISGSVHKDEGSADTSFYTISVGGGLRLSVGAGISSVGAELGLSGDVTKVVILYCLEQFLDSGKMGKMVLLPEDIGEIIKSRNKMQKREKELLSIFGTKVEGYLKTLGIIPVSVYVDWPSLTKVSSAEKAINASVAVDASLELGIPVLTSMGLSVSANTDVKIWKRPSGYMSLITEDCFPSDGLSAKDITKLLGEKYDHSETFGGKSDTNVLPTILGDLRAYNVALNILASSKSNKDATKRKHEIEKRWLPKRRLTSEGRIGMLKSFIATAVTLRESAKTDREIELFKQIHEELSRLDELMEFSKRKSSRNATFMTQAKARNSAIKASASVATPVGDAGFSITRSKLRDNPFQEENGDYVQFDINLPLSTTGVLGMRAIRAKLEECKKIGGQQPATSEYEDLFSLSVVGMEAVDNMGILSNIPVPAGLVSFTGSSVITIMMTRVDAPSAGAMRNLPNETLIEKFKNEWVIQYIKSTAYFNKSTGKADRIIGTNTLTYLTARFNAFCLGLQYSKDAMSPWNFLKKKQMGQFLELFKNMTKQGKNVRYELQNMYNTIMSNIGMDNDVSRRCTQIFAEFLSACKKVANSADGSDAQKQAFQDASKLLDDIFRMNFEHNFMPDYNKAYKISN